MPAIQVCLSVLSASLGHWRQKFRKQRELFELQCAGTAEVERIARDLGLSSSELRAMASDPDRRDLLRERLRRLHLDASELDRCEPAIFRDLQRVCALCAFKGRCARDLAQQEMDPAWEKWWDYCPNSATLSALDALNAYSADRPRAPRMGASHNQTDPANWE